MKGKDIYQVQREQVSIADGLLDSICSNGYGKEADSYWTISTDNPIAFDKPDRDAMSLNNLLNSCNMNGFGTLMIIKNPSQ